MTPATCLIAFPGLRQQFAQPKKILSAGRLDEVRAVLRAAETHAQAGAWVVGMVSFEAAPAFDPAYRVQSGSPLPLAWFAVFDEAQPLPVPIQSSVPGSPSPEDWSPDISRARFDADIRTIHAAILAGEVYQVNHSLRLTAAFAGDALTWFHQLRAAQPKSYAAYLDLGRQQMLSLSPELFFRRDAAGVTVKPMKGTAPRGRWMAEDARLRDALHVSPKNRAENLMIVDLIRNDLARIAVKNGVSVRDLFAVEAHPTVLQMTSTVSAQIRPDVGLNEIFGALFPCGSISGAPKIRALDMIAQREHQPRGAYCGAVGVIQPGGDAVFNVAIRSVTVDAQIGTATCGVGAGITWDSTAADEYAETLLKSRFLHAENTPFELIETLRWQANELVRLERHLARLAASAAYFEYPFNLAACRAQLIHRVKDTTQARVRVLLAHDGRIRVELFDLPAPPVAPVFSLAATPVDSASVWLFHKTTRREIYERAQAAHPGAFDVLLWNERHELTEFTRGNVVLEIDGERLTPPVDCGLLNGCLRQELIDQDKIREARLPVAQLARAQRVWFVNSLHGEIELTAA